MVLVPPIYASLPSVMTALNADPIFHICPVCPTCLKVYPSNSQSNTSCCSKPLFITTPTPAEQRHGETTRRQAKPILQFLYKSLEEQLAEILALPGMEDEIEKGVQKANRPRDGTYSTIFDGDICRELPTNDDGRFFYPTEAELESGELRIGVTLGIDWFSYLRSQIAPSHTSCPMSYSIINLPPHLRSVLNVVG